MKYGLIALGLLVVAGAAFAVNEALGDETYSWRYKMTAPLQTLTTP